MYIESSAAAMTACAQQSCRCLMRWTLSDSLAVQPLKVENRTLNTHTHTHTHNDKMATCMACTLTDKQFSSSRCAANHKVKLLARTDSWCLIATDRQLQSTHYAETWEASALTDRQPPFAHYAKLGKVGLYESFNDRELPLVHYTETWKVRTVVEATTLDMKPWSTQTFRPLRTLRPLSTTVHALSQRTGRARRSHGSPRRAPGRARRTTRSNWGRGAGGEASQECKGFWGDCRRFGMLYCGWIVWTLSSP